MWNYYFAVQSTFILGIILVFYFSLPRLSIRMNRTFVNMLIIQSAVIFFDIVSSWADNNYQLMEVSVLYLLNSLYFMMFFARAFIYFIFTANVFKVDPLEDKVKTFILSIPFIIACLMVATCPRTGWIYSIQSDGYHAGPFYNTLYVISYFYLLGSFITMYVYRRNVKKRRYRYSMTIFNGAVLVGLIMRWAFPTFLLMDTFCLMSIIVAYLSFENPEFYLDLKGAVFNSDAFRQYIEERNGRLSNRLLCVVIHNYYEMRDVYGSRQMDEGIGMLARYLAETFEDCNLFYYRRGRFMLLGPKNMSYEDAMNKINERFLQPWVSDDVELYLEPGYVTMELDETLESTDSFFNALLAAMNDISRQDGTKPFDMSQVQVRESENETALKRYLGAAIDEDRVEVFLQALVDSDTEQIVGAEALCRIRDAEGNLISPAVFIPIAESNGKINLLGEQVFEKTCRYIKENDVGKMGIKWINVNLSPIQFMKMDLADRYAAIIRKYDIDPGMIHLEITEESMVDDAFLHKQVHAMQEKGFMFVLDDYGTGYSNLTRLKNCPFTNVKLDMSLVRDFYNNPDEILPNMIRAFKNMNFEVTAEGVEDKSMANVLRDIGCDYLQGFHYSKPIPMDEFTRKYMMG